MPPLSITIPFTDSKIRKAVPSPLAIPDDGMIINGHHFPHHLLVTFWKENKTIFGPCDCGRPNAPRGRYKAFVCARCRKAEAALADSNKSKDRTLTSREREAERKRQWRSMVAGKYLDAVYRVALRGYNREPLTY